MNWQPPKGYEPTPMPTPGDPVTRAVDFIRKHWWAWLALAVIVAMTVATFTSEEGEDLDPSYKQFIDTLVGDRDCAGLQEAFDNADERGTADQMRYIDDSMRRLGCYD